MRPVVAALIERYKFVKFPTAEELIAQRSHKFEGGTFTGADKVEKVVDLTVHDDGLVIETRSSTKDCDLFAEEALTWVSTDFELPSHRELVVRRIYSSEVTVQFEREVSVFNSRFLDFVRHLRGDAERAKSESLELSHLNFSPDYGLQSRSQGLRIEREAGVPFASNSYYSALQATTESHLKILAEFESAACP